MLDLRNEIGAALSSLPLLANLLSESFLRLGRQPVARLPFPLQRTVTSAYAAQIVALDQPVLRNLLITQAYHDLSLDMAHCLRSPWAVNWATMASWASKRAGQTIRNEDLPWEQEVVSAIRLLPGGTLLTSQVAVLSGAIAEGNRVVFSEVAVSFARFVEMFSRAQAPDAAALARYLAPFEPGPVAKGGQDELRRAFTLYHQACFERDANRKAELIFAANLWIAIQEQSRLQPHIAKALPVELAPLATQLFLTLTLSDGRTYRLGEDLPARPFARHLERIEDADLAALLKRLDHDPESTVGSGAWRWDRLQDRMAFIVDLFRLHGSDRSLFEEPVSLREWWGISGMDRPSRWRRGPALPAAYMPSSLGPAEPQALR